jgi:hypothetical protein
MARLGAFDLGINHDFISGLILLYIAYSYVVMWITIMQYTSLKIGFCIGFELFSILLGSIVAIISIEATAQIIKKSTEPNALHSVTRQTIASSFVDSVHQLYLLCQVVSLLF